MGLEDYGEGNGVFLKIKHGHICQESKTEKEGWKKVEGVLQDGTPWRKWIRPYKAVSGFVDKIERYDRESEGRKYRGWDITLNDNGEIYRLDIPFGGVRVNSRWMKVAESIDYHKPVRFSAWTDKKTDSTALNIQQDGVTVPQKYTREEPGDMPEPIQRSSGKWDYGAQEDFLVDRIVRFVIPNVELIAANRKGTETKPEVESEKAKTVAEAAGLELADPDESEMTEPLKAIQRTVKALAGTKIANGSSETELLKDYFGTADWDEISKLPEALLKAQAGKLDQLVPF